MKLDGFLVQLPGELFGRDLEVRMSSSTLDLGRIILFAFFFIKSFAKAFCKILMVLSDSDPNESKCMQYQIDRPGWVSNLFLFGLEVLYLNRVWLIIGL